MFVLKHQTVSRLLPDSREKMSPTHALGVRFPTSPLPRFLEPPRSPHPAFRDVCQGGSGDPDGSLPTPTPPLVPLSLGFCSFSFFHRPSAKGLRKLPAPGPSRARSWGPGHTPGQARPCPCHLGRPAPSSGPLPPHSDPTEIDLYPPSGDQAGWWLRAQPEGPSHRLWQHPLLGASQMTHPVPPSQASPGASTFFCSLPSSCKVLAARREGPLSISG